MSLKDERMKLMNEVLAGVKVLYNIDTHVRGCLLHLLCINCVQAIDNYT